METIICDNCELEIEGEPKPIHELGLTLCEECFEELEVGFSLQMMDNE